MINKNKIVVASELVDRIRGCLLGVAIGDALGAPFEGIKPRFNGWIDDFYPFYAFPRGAWTDDTGMTLATCEALIEHDRSGRELLDCLSAAFKKWANSPACRRTGHSVYHAAKYGHPDENSWGSGALMRMAPLAIYAFLKRLNLHEAVGLAMRVARKTHGHPLATLPAVEFVLTLIAILSGEGSTPENLAKPWELINLQGEDEEWLKTYRLLRPLPNYRIPATSGLWLWKEVLENCLGLREGSSLAYMPRFDLGVLKAINTILDRDTAGAVAGALLGAYWGLKGIPQRWLRSVDEGEKIIKLADDLTGGKKTMPDFGRRKEMTEGASGLYRAHQGIGIIDFSLMKICLECCGIYGFFVKDDKRYHQGCMGQFSHNRTRPEAPRGDEHQERWPWGDYNQVVELCHICGQELLPSGSKWSVWLCRECKKRAVELNTFFQKAIIPIGHHSLMVGIGIRGQDAIHEEKFRAFLKELDNWNAMTTNLGEWARHIIATNLQNLGYTTDPLLVEYLARAKNLPEKAEVFKEMRAFSKK